MDAHDQIFDSKVAASALLPGVAMAAAHWFPWRQTLGRPLPRLAAYAIGTVAIVCTAAYAIAGDSRGTAQRHAGLVLLSAASAGATTIAAWTLDHILHLHHREVQERAYHDTLTTIGQS